MLPERTKPQALPAPKNHLLFDPWNSASPGHQRAESNPSTSWRRTREAKLAQQLRTGDSTINSFVYRGPRAGSDMVYEKSEWEWDWGCDARGGRGGAGFERRKRGGSGYAREGGKEDGQRDIRCMMRAGKGLDLTKISTLEEKEKGKSQLESAASTSIFPPPASASIPEPVSTSIDPQPPYDLPPTSTPGAFSLDNTAPIPPPSTQTPLSRHQEPPSSTILANTTIYINGQTTPLISDHKLKTLLVSHGATLALSLSRRITHVIIGNPNTGPGRGGAGGGLAAGKIQKEIRRRVSWRGVRVVGVEWVLESIKAGKRLPETRFAVNLSGQRSVLGFM
ncbi:uncharacterized protein BDV17DRAFT_287137 [Aspergillus undulatus]|uniref:uncharacterized protein n=1 Tax=Aspergillus undulatus TaxID=1810928 RepID=UPI003CCDE2B6